MGMDLSNESGETLSLSRDYWCDLLEKAHQHGWELRGTLPPIFEPDYGVQDWHQPMDYFSNGYQTMTVEDAEAAAKGLIRAIEKGELSESDLDVVAFLKGGEVRIG